MRLRRGRHTYLAAVLYTVNGRYAFFGQQTAPGAVGNDHQFGDQLVERAAAFAFADVHPTGFGVGRVAVDGKVIVVVALHRRRLAAPAFTGVGQLPERFQFGVESKLRQSGCSFCSGGRTSF